MEFINELDFDYMDNYRALLACVLSKRQISVDTAIYIVSGQRTGNFRRTGIDMTGRKHYTVPVYVEDILENKIIKFESSKEAAEILGMSKSTVSVNLDKSKIVKNRYKFTTEKPEK